MQHSSDTNTIPRKVQARNRLFDMDQVCKVEIEEEITCPIDALKEEKEEGWNLAEVDTSTFITLKNVPPRVSTAEAYINVTHGLSPEWKYFIGNNLLDWITVYESEDLTRPISVEIKFPKKISYTADVRVESIESDEVKGFCEEHDLLQYLISVIDMVREFFPTIQELSLEKEEDPESGEEWIVIDINVRGGIEEVLENYNNYITMFVSVIPCSEREKIILSYNIL